MEHHPTQKVVLQTSTGGSDNIQIVKVIGPLTMNNFFEFQELTRKKPFAPVMLIDLSETPYIDSAALGSLVGVHVSCSATGRKYALVGVNERLHKLFEMSNVHTFLVEYETLAEAEAAFA